MRGADFPDFFLVGAPKCGTSALYDFLGQHPDIFLPRAKELLVFASDLSYPSRLSRDEFATHFQSRRREHRVGTAHTAYMQSTQAADEIKAVRPDAQIIIMLRNPLEVLASWHSELLYQTVEEIGDFEAALAAEPDRRQGKRVPRGARNSYVESLFYRDVVAFSAQVERYVSAFGRPQVHIVVHDDFVHRPAGVYRDVLTFLGVNPHFEPQLAVVNPNKVVRSRALQELYFGTAAPGHRAVRRLIPRTVRQRLLAMNVRHVPRPDLSPVVKERLAREFGPEVARLESLLGRDFSNWIGAVASDRSP